MKQGVIMAIKIESNNGFQATVVNITSFGDPIDDSPPKTFKPGILCEGEITLELVCDPDLEIIKLGNDSIAIHYPGITVPYWGLGIRNTTVFSRKAIVRSVIKYPNYTKRGYKRLINNPKYTYHPPSTTEFEGYITKAKDGSFNIRVISEVEK